MRNVTTVYWSKNSKIVYWMKFISLKPYLLRFVIVLLRDICISRIFIRELMKEIAKLVEY